MGRRGKRASAARGGLRPARGFPRAGLCLGLPHHRFQLRDRLSPSGFPPRLILSHRHLGVVTSTVESLLSILFISSAEKALMVWVRIFPKVPMLAAKAVMVSSSGASAVKTASY